MRITIAPVTGLAGQPKAVKRPETLAEALEVAGSKEVLGAGVKPQRLFFGDGGEIDADAWELVGDGEKVFVSAGEDFVGEKPATPAPAAPVSVVVNPAFTQPMPFNRGEPNWELVKKTRQTTDKMATGSLFAHGLGFCIGLIPFFANAMFTINDTAGNTAFIMFVFIPTTGIWSLGVIGAFLMHPASANLHKDNACCGSCCADYRGRPNMGCSQMLTVIALVLHSIIAYVETFLMSTVPGVIMALLIVKNVLCITAEIFTLYGACLLQHSLKDVPPAAGTQMATPAPMQVVGVTGTGTGTGPGTGEAV